MHAPVAAVPGPTPELDFEAGPHTIVTFGGQETFCGRIVVQPDHSVFTDRVVDRAVDFVSEAAVSKNRGQVLVNSIRQVLKQRLLQKLGQLGKNRGQVLVKTQ